MKGSSIISAVHHLKNAQECFDDFVRDHKGTTGARLFEKYGKKVKTFIEWICLDLITHPLFTNEMREAIRQEYKSDVLAIPAINEKIALLNPLQREAIETAIDQMLTGELEIINE